MDGTKRCAGFNVTSSRLQFVEIEKTSDKLLVTNFGQTFISPSINFEDQDESGLASKLQTAYDEITIQNPLNNSAVSFSLPPELFITIQLPYDKNLTAQEMTEEFRWEISLLFPFHPADQLAIKFYELAEDILPGRFNALVVALNKKYLLLLKNFCARNKLSPILVDSASVTTNGFINNYFTAQNSGTINIYNSNYSITLFINLASKPAYVKVFQKTSKDYIGSILQILSEEKIKSIISRSISNGFFSGDDIGNETISHFKQVTGIEFNKFNPFNFVEIKSDFGNQEISSEHYTSYTAATGIAARSN
jgi:Tfp pilus assembly PilM family ATPase